jgi:hypothetical protein
MSCALFVKRDVRGAERAGKHGLGFEQRARVVDHRAVLAEREDEPGLIGAEHDDGYGPKGGEQVDGPVAGLGVDGLDSRRSSWVKRGCSPVIRLL